MLDHELTLLCDFYTPTDDELIPTGEIRAVAGTPYDFRQPRPVRNPSGPDLRHEFRRRARRRDATAWRRSRGVRSPKQRPDDGAAQQRARRAVLRRGQARIARRRGSTAPITAPHAGLCLEPQAFPDSPNRRHFTDCVLRPGGRIPPHQRIPLRLIDGGSAQAERRDAPRRASGALLAPEALARARFGERLADLEAEIVHRGFLAHREVLALGLALGLFGRTGDVDRHLGLDFRMQMDRGLVQAERLDRVRAGRHGCDGPEKPAAVIASAMSRAETEP